MSIVQSAIDHIGLSKLAQRFGYYPSAVQKWHRANRLPATELSGLTQYAAAMEEMSGGKFTAEKLLAETREQWEKCPPRKRGRGQRKYLGAPAKKTSSRSVA